MDGRYIPLAIAAIAVVIILSFAVIALRNFRAEAARKRPFSSDPRSVSEYADVRMREQYLEVLKKTDLMIGLAIVLSILAVIFVAAGLAKLGEVWLIASAACAALAASLFWLATSNRKYLSLLVDAVRHDWKVREAVHLAEQVTEPDVRTRLLTILSLQMSGMVPPHGTLREIVARKEETKAPPGDAPTYYQWRAHFRRCGRRGRRIVLERDYL